MDYTDRLAISYYETITALNEPHHIFLVRHRDTGKICIRKELSVYNRSVYEYLYKHPVQGIPCIYALYEEQQTLTVIEEYFSGETLAERIRDHSLTLSMVFQIMNDLCSILIKLHALTPPIIHRDIKPSNVLVDAYSHALLIDFNAAKLEHGTQSADTRLLGTAGYAAPEQYGFGSSTTQTDIYALGVLLREMIGSLPEKDRIPAFSSVIDDCTRLDPGQRMESAVLLQTRLEEIHRHSSPGASSVSGHSSSKVSGQNPECSASHEKSFLPPGFRSRTPWKMLCASAAYLLLITLCLTMDIPGAVSAKSLWIQRIGCLIWLLSLVFVTSNYGDVQRINPLCRQSNRLLRLLGVLIMDLVVSFLEITLIVSIIP